jgi:hypothetical protein
MRSVALVSIGLLLGVVEGFAQSPLRPGEYITEGGWGHLVISSQGDRLVFTIESAGPNGHSCDVEGEIRNGKATLEGRTKDQPCIIAFDVLKEGIDVKPEILYACGGFCGARAAFDGLYLLPPPGCTIAAVQSARDTFKNLYDRRAYADARATLEPLLERCGPTLDWIDNYSVRNDLAVTFYHLNDRAACLKVLEPMREDAGTPESELAIAYAPANLNSVRPILRATRTNLKLCQAK